VANKPNAARLDAAARSDRVLIRQPRTHPAHLVA
jgi:hypothetical protein